MPDSAVEDPSATVALDLVFRLCQYAVCLAGGCPHGVDVSTNRF